MKDSLFTGFDPEMRIPGFPAYAVSANGRVRRVIPNSMGAYNGHTLKPANNRGYLKLILYDYRGRRRDLTVHSIVLLAWSGPRPKGMTVNHIDGNKHNNDLSNLQYVTHSENNRHAFSLGLRQQWGESNPGCKISAKDVRAVKRARGSQGAIARRFGISQTTVCNIRNSKSRQRG